MSKKYTEIEVETNKVYELNKEQQNSDILKVKIIGGNNMVPLEEAEDALKQTYEEVKHINPFEQATVTHVVDTQGTIRKVPTPGRNEKCPCGSGKKYKKCCINKEN